MGKDVQDEGFPVQHLDSQLLGEHPELGGGEGVVEEHQIGVQGVDQVLDLHQLALTDEGARVGCILVLQNLTDADPARGVQQGGKLVQGGVAGVVLRVENAGAETYQDGAVAGFFCGIFHISFDRPP
jgi:hypothetical protein